MEQKTVSGHPAAVSVIVPVYNGERYLPECIDSVLGQTFRDLELVLVDDGSADASARICDEAAQKDARVHVIHKANGGLMAAWMQGVRESCGAYISFLDCDDWLETDHLEKMTAALDRNSSSRQIICGGYVIEREWNHTREKAGSCAEPGVYEGERLTRQIKDRLLGNEHRTVILSRCMKLFSRQVLMDNMHFGNPAIRMGEDVNVTVPMFLDADRVTILRDNYDYHYRFVAASMVHGYDPGMQGNMHLLLRTLHLVMEEKAYPNGHMQVEKEALLQLCLVLKNELRRTDAGADAVAERVQRICREEQAGERLMKQGEKLRDPANRLLAFVMAHPSKARIRLVRRIFLLQAGR